MSTGENKLRSTCIKCGRKRFRSHLQEFQFITYITPVTKSASYHYACIDNQLKNGFPCYEVLINYDLNSVIMPYSRKKT